MTIPQAQAAVAAALRDLAESRGRVASAKLAYNLALEALQQAKRAPAPTPPPVPAPRPVPVKAKAKK